MSPRVSVQTSFQMTQPLLCSACERRFSEHGESYVLPLLARGRKFPLLERLRVSLPLYEMSDNAAFTCSSVGFDATKIGYFGLSVLWRAAVRPWQTFDRNTTTAQVDPRYMETVRSYLVGDSDFPKEVAVVATVATDFVSQQACFVPNRITDNAIHIAYGFLVKGLYYRFIFGDEHPPAMTAISCGGPDMNLIFMRDCSEKSWEPFVRLMETSVPKGKLGASKQEAAERET